MFVLLLLAAAAITMILERTLGLRPILGAYGPLTIVLLLAALVPSLAVSTRRLHDVNRRGWWLLTAYVPTILVMLLPLVGIRIASVTLILSLLALALWIGLLVLMAVEGTRGPNDYGPDPKSDGAAPTVTH